MEYTNNNRATKAKRVIVAIASVAIVTTIVFSGVNYFFDGELVKKDEIKKEGKKT